MFGRRMRRRLSSNLALATVIALLCSSIVYAQDSTTLSGTVTDPQGKLITGAAVTITNTATNVSRSVKTSDDGSYVFNQIQPGTYTLRVEAPGFKTAISENLQLVVRTPATANLVLEVGAVTETVTVTSGEVQINRQDATIGNSFSSQQITQLPLEGRNVTALLAAQPGVTFIGNVDASGGTTDWRNGTVNGGKSDQSNVTLDGVDVNDQQNQYAFNSVLRVTLDSIQEFRVVTTNPNAEQGRSSGAQVSLVTKSGTNNWHGSAYEYHRNTIFSANNFFNNAGGRFTENDFAVKAGQARVGDQRIPRPKLIRNVFGGSFGGPIQKDRLFFFLNYEGRRDAREESVVRVVPSSDLRQGIFTYRDASGTIIKMTPAQVTAFDPLHLGPNPGVLSIFQQYPQPNDNTVGDLLNTFGFRFNSPIHLRWNTYISRLDYNVTRDGQHSVFWRGNLQNDKDNSTQQFPGQAPRFTNLTNSKGFATGYNATLKASLVNIFRLGYTRQGIENAGSSPLSGSHIINFRTFDDLDPAPRSLIRLTPTWNVADDLAWTRGSHSMQFGVNLRWIRNERLNFSQSFFTANTNKAWLQSARPLRPPGADSSIDHAMMALLGIVSQIDARYNVGREGDQFTTLPEGAPIARRYAANEYEWYGQDSWRVKPNLTLTYGLRYSLYSPPWETNGLQVAPDTPLGEWFNRRGVAMQQGIPNEQAVPDISFKLAGPVNNARGFYDWDKNNFAPRFAFAYTPNTKMPVLKWFTGEGKMTIRGGYSLVYDRIGSAIALNAQEGTLSFGLSTRLTNAAGVQTVTTAPRFTGITNIPSQLVLPPPPVAFPVKYPEGTASGGFAITAGIDDSLITPYSQTINFSIARELPGNMVFEAAYVGRLARHVLVDYDLAMPLNLVDPQSGMDYFTAAQMLVKMDFAGTPVSQVPKIAFWENLWPGLARNGLTSTQVAYNVYSIANGDGPDYTTALADLDVFCSPACSKFGPYALFDDQFSSIHGLRSQMPTNYHSLQLMVRRRFTNGFQFDFNYTYSRSQDWASTVERQGLITSSASVWNSWSPQARKSVSDFDLTHQLNANGIWELPVGKGRSFMSKSPGWLDAVLGGWQVATLFRVTSGLPTYMGNGLAFPTNWEFTGAATLIKEINGVGVTKDVKTTPTDRGGPNIFADPKAAFESFQRTLPGGIGNRNVLRGDGLFNVDLGLSKSWRMPFNENHKLQFRWEIFNVTNSVSFDPWFASGTLDSLGTFGKYTTTLNSPRVMQFALRYDF